MTITVANTIRLPPRVITVSASNHQLDDLSETNIVLVGTVAGQVVTLPSALSLAPGWTFFIRNESTQTAVVKSFQGQLVATVRRGQRAEVYLYDSSTVVGSWSVLTTGDINHPKLGSSLGLLFCSSGPTSDRWLGSGQWINYSNESPVALPLGGLITALTYGNMSAGSSIDLEFYKNGTSEGNKVFVWEIRGKRIAYKSSDLDTLVFNPGDYLSILARMPEGSVDPQPTSISLQVWVRVNNPLVSDGGTYA